MTIDKQIFMELLGELQTYYKREFTPFVQRAWYKHLSDRLTTEEFVQAVEQVVVKREFMPTPEQLVSSIKGDSEGQALVAWERCLKAAARDDRTILGDLSSQAKFALTAVGGLSRLGQSEEEKHTWLRKEFLSAWKSWLPSLAKALPPADDTLGLIETGVDQAAVEHMRSLIEKVSSSRQKVIKQTEKISVPLEDSSSISTELQVAVEKSISQGANRVELSFAISDALELGAKSDELKDIICSNPALLAAQAIKNFYSVELIVASSNGKREKTDGGQ